MVIGPVRCAAGLPSISIAICSGVTRADGSAAGRPLTRTRPARISARASDRLASPSFESARSSETLAVVAKLKRDAKILRAERIHRALEIVFRRRADAHLLALNRRLDLLELQVLEVLDDLSSGF